MDYSTYFPTPPQGMHYFGLPPAPNYVQENKLGLSDSLEAGLCSQYHFQFPQQHAAQKIISNLPPQPALTDMPPHRSEGEVSPVALAAPVLGHGSGIEHDAMLDGPTGHPADTPGRARRDSEERESMTPAQSRRKAQNRAAQRAFRERKERHVKELEAKLSALESSATSLATDNERLKLALQRATTENELLRATSSQRLSVAGSLDGPEAGQLNLIGLLNSSTSSSSINESLSGSSDGIARSLIGRNDSTSSTDSYVVRSPADPSASASWLPGGPSPHARHAHSLSFGAPPLQAALSFIPAAATWDLIQAHPLVKRGIVDIADVCEALRGTARCDGGGPVFQEEMIWRAVEQVRRGGGDTLI